VQLISQSNGGAAAARNRGLAAARGALVAFLDSDDAWRPEYLQQSISALQRAPEAVLAFAGWQYMDSQSRLLSQSVMPFAADPIRARAEVAWRNAILPSGAVARRAAALAVGGFDVALCACEDWDLWIRLSQIGQFVSVPAVLMLYRAHPASKTESIEVIERCRLAVNAKNFGAINGDWADWPEPKQRAVGYTLFVVGLDYYRLSQQSAGFEKIRRAIEVWPGLLEQDEFYYELGCANQDRGARGSALGLNVPGGADLIRACLPDTRRARFWSRACLNLMQLAWLAGDRALARAYAMDAARFDPFNLRSGWRAAKLVLKSYLPG
jgi:glycosyltransferase involved in cell wall biosynthesis